MSLARPIATASVAKVTGAGTNVIANINQAKAYAAGAAKMSRELGESLSNPNVDVNASLNNIEKCLTEARILRKKI